MKSDTAPAMSPVRMFFEASRRSTAPILPQGPVGGLLGGGRV